MQANRLIVLVAIFLSIAATALAQHSHMNHGDSQVMHTHHPIGDATGKAATLSGYVRDVACLLRNPDAGEATSPLIRDCMKKCVAGGSPIGILTEQGEMYTPISDTSRSAVSGISCIRPAAPLEEIAHGRQFDSCSTIARTKATGSL
jgi:hypothetical protein